MVELVGGGVCYQLGLPHLVCTVLVLLSAHVDRFSVSHMQDMFSKKLPSTCLNVYSFFFYHELNEDGTHIQSPPNRWRVSKDSKAVATVNFKVVSHPCTCSHNF